MDGYLGELISLQATDEDTFRAVTPVRFPAPTVAVQGTGLRDHVQVSGTLALAGLNAP